MSAKRPRAETGESPSRARSQRVARWMTRDPVCVRLGTTVGQVGEVLAKHGVSGAPVVDEQGRVAGVVSQHDLVKVAAVPDTVSHAGRFFTDVDEFRDLGNLSVTRMDEPVESVMHREVFAVSGSASVATAARRMREHRIHRLLVLEADRPVGIVTALDLLGVLAGES